MCPLCTSEYNSDGTLKSFTPTAPEAKPVIPRRMVTKPAASSPETVVPFVKSYRNRAAIRKSSGLQPRLPLCQASSHLPSCPRTTAG
jgi:hypothetical protein